MTSCSHIGVMPVGAHIRLGDGVIRIVAPSIASQGLAVVVMYSVLRRRSADCFSGCILSAYNAIAKLIATRASGKCCYRQQRCYKHDAEQPCRDPTSANIHLTFHLIHLSF